MEGHPVLAQSIHMVGQAYVLPDLEGIGKLGNLEMTAPPRCHHRFCAAAVDRRERRGSECGCSTCSSVQRLSHPSGSYRVTSYTASYGWRTASSMALWQWLQQSLYGTFSGSVAAAWPIRHLRWLCARLAPSLFSGIDGASFDARQCRRAEEPWQVPDPLCRAEVLVRRNGNGTTVTFGETGGDTVCRAVDELGLRFVEGIVGVLMRGQRALSQGIYTFCRPRCTG